MPPRKPARKEKIGGPFRGGPIPDRLITDAKKLGDVNALYELFRNISSSNFRMEVVEVVFHHLQPKWMLSLEASSNLSTMEREFLEDFRFEQARAANFCTSEAMTALLMMSPPHLYSRVVEEIIAHLDDYFAWAKYLVSSRIPTHDGLGNTRLCDPTSQCHALLLMVEEEDRRLSREIVYSERVVEFAITAWVAHDPATSDAFLSFEAEHLCPIVALFLQLLLIELTRQKVFDILFGSGKRSKRLRMQVVRAAISRCSRIARMDRQVAEDMVKAEAHSEQKVTKETTALEVVFKYLAQVLEVVTHLCLNADMSRAFLKSTFWFEFTQALRSWLLEKSRRTDEDAVDRHRGFKLLQMVEGVVARQAIAHGDRHWKQAGNACLQIVQGGGVAILIEGMHSIQARDKRSVIVHHMLVPLQDQSQRHPIVVDSITSEIVKALGQSFWNTRTFAHTGWTKLWDSVSLDFLAASLTPFKKDIYSLCDNLDCDNDSRSFASSRMCSGCNSVLYCSDACQQRDWTVLHRAECKAARTDFGAGTMTVSASDDNDEGLIVPADRNPERIRYRQFLRQYQAQLAANRAMIELSASASLRQDMRCLSFPGAVLLLEYDKPSSVDDVFGYLEARGIDHWYTYVSSEDGGSDSSNRRRHYFSKRMSKLLSDYGNWGADDGRFS